MSAIKEAVILFADLVNSTELANNLSLREFCDYIIEPFQRLVYDVVNRHLKRRKKCVKDCFYQTRGDEVCIIIYSDELTLGEKLMLALGIARELKLRWLISDFNTARIESGKRPTEIKIGINTGEVMILQDIFEKTVRPEGYAINLAKRVEGTGGDKGLYTLVMASRSAYQEAVRYGIKVAWSEPYEVTFKGVSRPDFVYEVKYYQGLYYWGQVNELRKDLISRRSRFREIFERDYLNTWLGLEIAGTYFYRMQIEEAIDVLQKILLGREGITTALSMLSVCYQQLALDGVNPDLYMRKAESLLEEALAIEPRNEDLWIDLGILHYNKGDYDKAGECMTKAIDVGVDKRRATLWRWKFALETGEKTLEDLLMEAGWMIEKEKEKSKVLEITENYLDVLTLPNNKADTYLFMAAAIWKQWKDKKLARLFLQRAYNELRKIPQDEALYASFKRRFKLVKKEEFLEECKKLENILGGLKERQNDGHSKIH